MGNRVVALRAHWTEPGAPVVGVVTICALDSPAVAAWCRHLWDEDGPGSGLVTLVPD